MTTNAINNSVPWTPITPAHITHSRNAQFGMIAMIDRASDSIGLLQQQADEENVMVTTQQELSIYAKAKTILAGDAEKVEGETDPVKQSGYSTEYQLAQTTFQNEESQYQGYVSGATSNGSQDSQNLNAMTKLGDSATQVQNATQQLMNGFN